MIEFWNLSFGNQMFKILFFKKVFQVTSLQLSRLQYRNYRVSEPEPEDIFPELIKGEF